MRRFVVSLSWVSLLSTGILSISMLGGCNKQTYTVVKSSGVCLCEGRPISTGWVQFSPVAVDDKTMPGKSAIGRIQPDGSFVLSTYDEGDGAISGSHRVRVMEPSMPERSEIADGAPVPKKHGCVLPSDLIVEIQPEMDNDLTIQLVKKKAKPITSQGRPNYEG